MSRAFRIQLTGGQEAPPNASTASGLGTAVFDDSGANPFLSYAITTDGVDFVGLAGPPSSTPGIDDNVNNAHFHEGPAGVNGPLRFDWDLHDADDFTGSIITGNSWRVSGRWETTDPVSIAGFTGLFSGATLGNPINVYANIHTHLLPDGEMRGQLVTIATDGGETVNGTAGAEFLPGLGGADTVRGFGGNDTLEGGTGNDTLDGGLGADLLAGGTGNDFYFVDGGDSITEAAGDAGDRAFATASFTLTAGASIELLSTNNHAGTAAINLTGNELANTIYGNAGANTVDGGGQNDSLVGLGGDDVLNGGEGDDTLNGGLGDDQMNGGDGADRFYGGPGTNTMTGGTGNDWYIVTSSVDVINEGAADGATDRVFASVDYALGAAARIEILSTNNHAGTAAIDLSGNGFANVVRGNNSPNVLNGGAFRDVLYGAGGADIFVFDTAPGPGPRPGGVILESDNVDILLDFDPAADTFHLAVSGFNVFVAGGGGPLGANRFTIGAAPTTQFHKIVYNDQTGQLIHYPEGSDDLNQALQFALVQPGLALTHEDFVIV